MPYVVCFVPTEIVWWCPCSLVSHIKCNSHSHTYVAFIFVLRERIHDKPLVNLSVVQPSCDQFNKEPTSISYKSDPCFSVQVHTNLNSIKVFASSRYKPLTCSFNGILLNSMISSQTSHAPSTIARKYTCSLAVLNRALVILCNFLFRRWFDVITVIYSPCGSYTSDHIIVEMCACCRSCRCCSFELVPYVCECFLVGTESSKYAINMIFIFQGILSRSVSMHQKMTWLCLLEAAQQQLFIS